MALALLGVLAACRTAPQPSLRVVPADGERPAMRWTVTHEDVTARSAAVVITAENAEDASNRDPLAELGQRLAAQRTPSISGLRLVLGAGEAPYDDAPYSNAVVPAPLRGFSDTLIQLQVEDQVAPGLSLVGAMAASRYQDEPILSGLEDAEFAWVTIGLRWSF